MRTFRFRQAGMTASTQNRGKSQFVSGTAGTLLLLCVMAVAPASAATPRPEREVLPDNVVPVHYDLSLAPDAEALTFSGKVSITIKVTKSAASITLNASNLEFDHAALDGGADAQVAIDKRLGRATLEFAKPVPTGQHVLAIQYHGKIGRATLGFFAMDYVGADGPRRTLATNFEPADARDMLPCWDEPGRKATFTISVDAPKDRTAISNMPIAKVTPLSPTTQRVRFAETPKMSTYLLFLGVGDFERIHQQVDGVDVGVVVKRGDTAKAAYALDQATRLLHYYNDYFGVTFPLPKLDLIAAPGQIQGGSMENWGAIFYSQNHVLFDPGSSTEVDRQLVFLVVAHEMAHQWFGDLVTMAWWDNLWLNEGFARWMQTYAADDLHPEWQTGLQAAGIFELGKQADSVPSTHPIVQEVNTADQAEQSFDTITYDKGASVITMINAYVGRDKFREGVRRYMRAHVFGNTVDTDLWRPLQEVAGLPITAIEKDFTRQEGLPLVNVTPSGSGVSLSQSRFADDPATLRGIPAQHWRLPLAVGAIKGPKPYLLLQGTANVNTSPPLVVNAGQLGYARVLYHGATFDELADREPDLEAVDQLGFFNDAWAFALALQSSGTRVLKLTSALPASADPIVWDRVLDVLTDLDDHYGDKPQRAAFRRFALKLLAPVTKRLGPEPAANESSNSGILRDRLREAQAQFGEAEVIASARKLLASGNGTAAEQRTALDIVARQADAATFDSLLARAKQTSDPLEKLHVFKALAGVTDAGLARRMLDIALSDQVPAGTDRGLLLGVAAEHPDMTWEFLLPRLNDPKLPLSRNQRWTLASDVAAASSQLQRIKDLEAYEARNVPPEARRPFLSSVASIRQNERMERSLLPELDAWISSRQP
jgi:aminopeptidase N